MKIAIAGGHSAKAYGAVGYLDEYKCDRAYVAQLITALRSAGHTVIDCSNEMPTQNTELAEECRIANASGADLFIAVHFNSGGGTGTECFYSEGNQTGKQYAEKLSANVAAALGLKNRGPKTANFYVLRNTKMTAVLLEVCFVDSQADKAAWDKTSWAALTNAVVSAVTPIKVEMGWVKNSKGWWYRNADGSWPKSKWLKLDAWYYFDDEGYALSSCWRKINGYWYYFGSDCRMQTGWQEIKGKWYYLHPQNEKDHKKREWKEGSAHIGWIELKGVWYYLKTASEGTECSMACNETMTINGKSYTFDKSGAMQ